MSTNWVPMGDDPKVYETLHEGVPGWLEHSVWSWIAACSHESSRYADSRFDATFNRMDLALRWPNSVREMATSGHGLAMLRNALDDDRVLHIVDFLIVDNVEAGADIWNLTLDKALSDGGSAWRVGLRNGHPGLERRVPLGVQEAAEKIMESSEQAGQILSEAWHAAFGKTPDPEKAYKKAIVAVEEAAAPVVIPANKKASLGTVLSAMRDQKDWGLPLLGDEKHPSRDVVAQMGQALWSGESGRHGANGYRPSTQDEAEAAVLLAVPLVYFFTRQMVARQQ